jgi:hypothetical protein
VSQTEPRKAPHPFLYFILFLPFGATSGFVAVMIGHFAEKAGMKDGVIADFDGTLIKKVVDGKKVPSLISLLVDEKYLGVAGTAQTKELVAKYMPLEHDPSLAPEEKAQCMQEWWEASYRIMKEQKVSEAMIQEICNSRFVQLRDGVPEFFDFFGQSENPAHSLFCEWDWL